MKYLLINPKPRVRSPNNMDAPLLLPKHMQRRRSLAKPHRCRRCGHRMRWTQSKCNWCYHELARLQFFVRLMVFFVRQMVLVCLIMIFSISLVVVSAFI